MPLVSPSRMTIFLALHLAQFKWLQIFLGHSMKGKITPVPYEVPFPISSASEMCLVQYKYQVKSR